MKFLFDLLPVILFFAAYKFAGTQPEASHAFATQWLGDNIALTQAPILIATAVTIVVPLREHVAMIAQEARAAGFGAVVYGDGDGNFWNPDPPGNWRPAPAPPSSVPA